MIREYYTLGNSVTINKGSDWLSVKAVDFGGMDVEFSGNTTSVHPYSGNTAITSIANGTITNVTGDSLFYGCSSLQSFSGTFPNQKTGKEMFSGCTSLTDVYLDMPKETSYPLRGVYPALTSVTYLRPIYNNMVSFSSLTDYPVLKKVTASTNISGYNTTSPLIHSGITDARFIFNNAIRLYNICSSGTSLTSATVEARHLQEAKGMFKGCPNLSGVNLILGDSKLTCTNDMFNGCSSLSGVDMDFSSIISAQGMFNICSSLTSFVADLPSLVSGRTMFQSCYRLKEFSGNLSQLKDGTAMFNQCSALTSFTSDLPNLQNGTSMFDYNEALTSFTSELPNLLNGYRMFYNCKSLTSFNVDMPQIISGHYMFSMCKSLQTFNSHMPNLVKSESMFSGCSALEEVVFDAPMATASPLYNGYVALTSLTLNLPSVSKLLQFNSTTNYPQLQTVNLTTNWGGTTSGAGVTVIGVKTTDATLCYNNATYLNRICNNASALTRVSITCPNLILPTTKGMNPLNNCPALQHAEITTKSANSGWTIEDLAYGTTPLLQYKYVDDLGDGLVRLTFTAQERPSYSITTSYMTFFPDGIHYLNEDCTQELVSNDYGTEDNPINVSMIRYATDDMCNIFRSDNLQFGYDVWMVAYNNSKQGIDLWIDDGLTRIAEIPYGGSVKLHITNTSITIIN